MTSLYPDGSDAATMQSQLEILRVSGKAVDVMKHESPRQPLQTPCAENDAAGLQVRREGIDRAALEADLEALRRAAQLAPLAASAQARLTRSPRAPDTLGAALSDTPRWRTVVFPMSTRTLPDMQGHNNIRQENLESIRKAHKTAENDTFMRPIVGQSFPLHTVHFLSQLPPGACRAILRI